MEWVVLLIIAFVYFVIFADKFLPNKDQNKSFEKGKPIISKTIGKTFNIFIQFIGGFIWGAFPAAILFANSSPESVFGIAMFVGFLFVVDGRYIDLTKRGDRKK